MDCGADDGGLAKSRSALTQALTELGANRALALLLSENRAL